jgi:2-polyprenyl-3-methyl-5-hydroxy-6-metoxy-1,4-benzoquinol methylase
MTDWKNYNDKNKRDTRMSEFWVKSTVNYFLTQPNITKLNILDYGCGYFDLGFALEAEANKVNGYDPYEPGIDYANHKKKRLNSQAIISSKIEDIKKDNYDLIILNGVVQYFHNFNELLDTLILFKSLFRHNTNGKIYLIDVVSTQSNLAIDALQNLYVATKNGLLTPMFIHLFKAAIHRNDKKLLHIEPSDIKKISHQAGFSECKILPENLSPSRQRFSCVIS